MMRFGSMPMATRIDVAEWMSGPESSSKSLHVSKPVEVSCYSRFADRSVKYGSREMLQSYKSPRLPGDLNVGFGSYIPKDETGPPAPVETLIRALKLEELDISEKVDILTYRNNLNKIALTPYNSRDAWQFDACRIGGTVFLEILRTGHQEPVDEMGQRFTFYGYKFEQLCTADGDDQEQPVDANEEFCALMNVEVGSHRVFLAAEIDCEMKIGDDSKSLKKYVELKTSREPGNKFHWEKLAREKYLKFWVQSYLGGVPIIKLGLRDRNGILRKVEHLETKDVPNLAFQICGAHWSSSVCLNFLSHCLTFIRRICREEGKTTRFSYDPMERAISCSDQPGSELPKRIREALKDP